jgi:EAL and modified HD-GYP domain-containing signal transduction protein
MKNKIEELSEPNPDRPRAEVVESPSNLPGLTLSLRTLDDEPGLEPRSSSTPSSADRFSQGDPACTEREVDWLDTVIHELLDDSALKVEAAGHTPVVAREMSNRHTEFADFRINPAASHVLSQVVLGYSPIIELARGVIGTRLTVVPVRPTSIIDAGALLEAVSEVWPEDGGIVSLNVASATLLTELLRARPATNVMIEVPAFLAAEPAHTDALCRLADTGAVLLLKGRPLQELPREALRCFRWSVVDLDDDRRGPNAAPPKGVTRRIPHLQSGVRTMAELRSSFARGAIAVIGWPLHEPLAEALEASPDMRVVLDAIQRIERGDATESIDHVLMRDPVLAFELMSHLSGNGELRIEIGSVRHAVAMVGQDKLRGWLVRLLSRSADDIKLRPANFAALRRGLLLRMLAEGAGLPEARSELFMCGVFSLLDRIYARPVGELVQHLALPERVHAALVDRQGPLFPLLELVRAIESESPQDIRAAAEAVFLDPLEINRALMRSLLVASRLECAEAPPDPVAGSWQSWSSPRPDPQNR